MTLKTNKNRINYIAKSIMSIILISGFLGPNYLANADPPTRWQVLKFESEGECAEAEHRGFFHFFAPEEVAKHYHYFRELGFTNIESFLNYLKEYSTRLHTVRSEDPETPLFSLILSWADKDLYSLHTQDDFPEVADLAERINLENQLREGYDNKKYNFQLIDFLLKIGKIDSAYFNLLPLVDTSCLSPHILSKILKYFPVVSGKTFSYVLDACCLIKGKIQQIEAEINDKLKDGTFVAESCSSVMSFSFDQADAQLRKKVEELAQGLEKIRNRFLKKAESLNQERRDETLKTISETEIKLEEAKQKIFTVKMSRLLESCVREEVGETNTDVLNIRTSSDILRDYSKEWTAESFPKYDSDGLRRVLASNDKSKRWSSNPTHSNCNSIFVYFKGIRVVPETFSVTSLPGQNIGEWELYGKEKGVEKWKLLDKFKGEVECFGISQEISLEAIKFVHTGRNSFGRNQMNLSSFCLSGKVFELLERQ
ncbi:MAG: hypothetical protein LBF33_01495 [Oscillospiraceae bacterium]|jgi:hypothetical protein|nr:hypothetical protein [Oscillospiraceae bacterium]